MNNTRTQKNHHRRHLYAGVQNPTHAYYATWNPNGFQELPKWVLKNIKPVEGEKNVLMLQVCEILFLEVYSMLVYERF